ncbi:MAG: glycosyltransferase family 2 protein, partial [Oscillospiraceae bacterium]|nr:glycosyltransferase family 2 protein [Oscillospiraceae bacterium]
MEKPSLYIVIPCYNEEQVLPMTAPMFREKLEALQSVGKISSESRVLFVNDGSKDKTWEIIRKLAAEHEVYEGLSLSRNRGHQNALLAGLMEAKERCDITISIDCDGQDDINAMDQMVEEYWKGAEIVYGVRSKRDTDTFFKRFTAEGYYKLLNKLGGEIVYNHADYRLVSARALREFANFREVNIFLRGMFPMVGFRSTCVYYERHERLAGESHYPLSKMLALAFDGITSLSVKPIRMISGIGGFFTFTSVVLLIWFLAALAAGGTGSAPSLTLICVCLLGGVQLLSLGVIGEYIGKIYLE